MRILVIIGTRPEAIKLSPVIHRLNDRSEINTCICLTGQHRELLVQGLADFHITPHHNLDVMHDRQSLNSISSRILADLPRIFDLERPDWVLVQGDTTSAMAAALTGFQHGIKVAHVEAGLRTGDPEQPWPEEMNRRIIGQAASLHFAPSETARDNLLREGVPAANIVVSGNTVIDALLLARSMEHSQALADLPPRPPRQPLIVCTLHRRENLTPGRLQQVEQALMSLAERGNQIVFPVHPNPALTATVRRLQHSHPNLHILRPLSYVPFIQLLAQATLVLTDSGGIQEEAAFLGKPLLVMRRCTERPEVLNEGAMLVGTDSHAILKAAQMILDAPDHFGRPAGAFTDLGAGQASDKIAEYLLSHQAAAA